MTTLKIEHRPPGELKPYARNARPHSRKQITQIAASIKAFGFNNPVLIDKTGSIIAGHALRSLRVLYAERESAALIQYASRRQSPSASRRCR